MCLQVTIFNKICNLDFLLDLTVTGSPGTSDTDDSVDESITVTSESGTGRDEPSSLSVEMVCTSFSFYYFFTHF